jgi:PIN domain nuclease of toxin-antitoxin system
VNGLLLATHVFLWFASGSPSLRPNLREAIESESGPVYLSVVSAWEIAIKLGLGKLEIDSSVSNLLGSEMTEAGIQLLDLSREDIANYISLGFPDPNHRDPFDRMLVVQARNRQLSLVTIDRAFATYEVHRLS